MDPTYENDYRRGDCCGSWLQGLRSFGVYRAIQQMPVREVEVRSLYQVVAARDMPMGTLLTRKRVKLVPWPAAAR